MRVFLLLADTGAHEPAAIMSVWSSFELADAERARITALPDGATYVYTVVAVDVDKPTAVDEWGFLDPIQS